LAGPKIASGKKSPSVGSGSISEAHHNFLRVRSVPFDASRDELLSVCFGESSRSPGKIRLPLSEADPRSINVDGNLLSIRDAQLLTIFHHSDNNLKVNLTESLYLLDTGQSHAFRED